MFLFFVFVFFFFRARSLIDNFEWNLGVAMRFGLVSVDNEGATRTFQRSVAPTRSSIFRFDEFLFLIYRCVSVWTHCARSQLKRSGEFYHTVVERNGFNQTDDVPVACNNCRFMFRVSVFFFFFFTILTLDGFCWIQLRCS